MGPVGRVASNFGDHGDRVYLVPPTFPTGYRFSPGTVGIPQTSVLNSREDGRSSTKKGNGRDMGGAVTRDGEVSK